MPVKADQLCQEFASLCHTAQDVIPSDCLTTHSSWRSSAAQPRLGAVERVILVMRQHLGELLTLQDMADVACLSPYHFSRVFSCISGISPCRYLAALRLQEAKRLLLTTDMSATDVCFEVGYSSLGTFTTHFTQFIGMSPARLHRSAIMITEQILDELQSYNTDPLFDAASGPTLSGEITVFSSRPALTFAGLFPAPIPQGKPVSGTVLKQPGRFHMPPVPDGSYWLLAAAFPQSDDPLTYLLPDDDQIYVGINQAPIVIRSGRVEGETDLILRPLQLTDPPILSALPILLSERMQADAAPPLELQMRQVGA
ncbi:MAG TPA: AraC family transcriptional regulator [Herpetosiphonaceae bacterium]